MQLGQNMQSGLNLYCLLVQKGMFMLAKADLKLIHFLNKALFVYFPSIQIYKETCISSSENIIWTAPNKMESFQCILTAYAKIGFNLCHSLG